MKKFRQFLEEIDLRGNKGLPDDYMNKADDQARTNLNVDIDSHPPFGPHPLGMELMHKVQESMRLTMGNLRVPQLEERWLKIEDLAKRILLEEFGEILDASEKPVELKIKLLRPWERESVNDALPDMDDSKASTPPNPRELVNDDELKKSVDKKKLLNTLNQGYAKNTKEIIRSSELTEPGLMEIFGTNWQRIYNLLLEITDIANKMDWIMPVDVKGHMMKNAPEGMAGACQVKWEKEDKDDEDNADKFKTKYDPNEKDDEESQGEEEDFTKIVVTAVGTDFIMLIHEGVKGIFQLLQSGSIKDDEELAKFIANNTESFGDESQEFRYGPSAQNMFRIFILSCRDCNRYSNMDARIYAKIALDIDRGGELNDGEFLELTKDVFSCFDLNQNRERKLEFELNIDRFNSSNAKRRIERMIADIIQAERDYEQELSKWEMEQKLDKGESKPNDDDDKFNNFMSDYGISGSKDSKTNKVDDDDDDDIDTLLDKLNSAKSQAEKDAITAKLNKLMESLDPLGRQIYRKEINRIVENKKYKK